MVNGPLRVDYNPGADRRHAGCDGEAEALCGAGDDRVTALEVHLVGLRRELNFRSAALVLYRRKPVIA